MNTISKFLIGTAVSGAMIISAASPASARDRHYGGGHHDGIGAGEVIAGALVIGGIAAIAASAGNDRYRDYNYDRAGYDGRNWRGYDRDYGNPRQAIAQCVNAAERSAGRYGRADVTEIRDIDRTSRGYTVRGRIAVNGGNRGWARDDWARDDWRYGNSGYGRGYDNGSFRCRVEYGRVIDLDFGGIRGL
jgi:hypothetical protein